jgi:hypothetical protein
LGYAAQVAGSSEGEPGKGGSVDEEACGVVRALRALAVGEAGFAYLLPEQRSVVAKLWRQLENSDAAGRFFSDVRDATAEVLPRGIEDLHPSWIAHSLADEPEHIVTMVRAALPESLRSAIDGCGSEVPGKAPLSVQREVVRLAFTELAPLCASDAGPLAWSLCRLSFDELLVEVTRRGARTVGQSLAGSAPAIRARAMASVGEPWAQQILAVALEPASKASQVTAVTLAEAMRGGAPRTPVERLRQVGILALRAELRVEHSSSIAKVAGRLPADLGRMLLGNSCP